VNLSITPHTRIIALVGVILLAAVAGGSMLLGRSGSPNAAKTPPARTHAAVTLPTKSATTHKTSHKTTVAATKGAKKTAHAGATHAAAAAHAATTAKAPASTKATSKAATAKHAPVRHENLVDANLPQPLQWQLAQHKVVVVSVYDPQSAVDAISVAEAHAGALEAGAGFLLVSVLDNSLAGLLTGVLPDGGLLPDPGVLIYRAPGTLALRIDGFADRDSVAQAAADVLAGQDGPTTPPAPPATTTP
jgi:hypothetical protein